MWKPTPENINALPPGLKEYVHDLETMCDPAGIIRENTLLKDELRMFGAVMYDSHGEIVPR